jgi:hypothetical protein
MATKLKTAERKKEMRQKRKKTKTKHYYHLHLPTQTVHLLLFADSGATQQMSDQKILFEDFTQIQTGTWSIAGIGDTHLQVLGKGHITVTVQVNNQSSIRVIKDVPGLGTNLFSIATATHSGLEARFSKDMVSFHLGDELVLTGKRSGNTLYLLDLKPHTASITSTWRIDSAYRAGLRASLLVWHQRLGHMNHQTILKMFSEELVSGLHLTNEKILKTLCTACELGKFHRQPLKIGRTRATRIGELVHSDVEGPMPSPSIGQARYYVLFTDFFSGWRVIYFMKCKSEVPACFRLFIASLLSEKGKTVRTLRSDNGRSPQHISCKQSTFLHSGPKLSVMWFTPGTVYYPAP